MGKFVDEQSDGGVADDIVVQEFIDGEEYMVTVIQMHNIPVPLTPCKVRFPPGGTRTTKNFLTQELKFHPDLGTELVDEQSLGSLCTRLQDTAVAAFVANSMWENGMGCEVDMRVPHDGQPVAPGSCV